TTIFVGNISWNVNKATLAEKFSVVGDVIGVRFIVDGETGKGKGFEYIEFFNSVSSNTALEAMTGFELDGRTLRIESFTRDRSGGGCGRRGGCFVGG
ncbi:hypothetical protein BDK51DRAFT_14219, partial [Blyttiomyces helicus]